MSSCCDSDKDKKSEEHQHVESSKDGTASGCCPSGTGENGKKKIDYMFWGTLFVVTLSYVAHLLMGAGEHEHGIVTGFTGAVFELMNTMWWGVVAGIIALGFLSAIPRDFIISLLGKKDGFTGVFRAALAGTLLDLCSHGILMVGAKLYERGASAGQVMAFLIASPWNSISLTLILVALIGLWWTLAFIVLSLIIGVITGVLFEKLVDKGVLPANPNRSDIPDDFRFWPEAKKSLSGMKWTPRFFYQTLKTGLMESRMILRWMLLGVIIASLLRVLLDPSTYETLFGPTVLGLFLTLIAATVIEVCSEGSTPIAADILTRADAPGNGFTFLMAGVSTDYTEMMVLREVTKSWKITLFLPLLTVPQILVVGYILNLYGV